MESWELREWYADFLDTCNRHDLDEVRGFVDAGVRRAHLPGGADAFVDDLADLFHGFPDWQWRRILVVIEDDRIAVHLRGTGTHTGIFRGIAATQRHVNVAEYVFLRVQNGRITEVAGTTDRAEIVAQLTG